MSKSDIDNIIIWDLLVFLILNEEFLFLSLNVRISDFYSFNFYFFKSL